MSSKPKNKNQKIRPKEVFSIKEFVNAIKKKEFPVQYELTGTVKYRYRLVAWSEDRIVLNISRFAPNKGFQSFNVDVAKMPLLAKDFMRFSRLAEKIGLIEEGTVREILEDLKYEL